ncbi:asparagine synthase (glutamine-hydrolyzing) [Desulfovibrio sp.]|uniref:asparagine synthase (glutamine-hydrolyzing) n=1 Tax=Desulfovibrio sp. TaxID=885 RepID=UPI0023C1F90E|nr:asparagine synthase (glutamine-hydrolyzing) [Desulfovibrio sp.]MDE7241723.1 asparagine synthase (glutamine-hydrolyzing) [Desulfovibrio sp.]
MCGIAGMVRLDGAELSPGVGRALKAMTDSMACRGPDGEGFWRAGPAALGHRRLSIIDLAGGSQPMQSADGRYCVVHNGEIYNFRELRRELEARGARFRTDSDTEVALEAYVAFGEDCLERLEGMFAFAVWDGPRQRLFCARDRFGKKPFFYTMQNGVFCFASELSALSLLGRPLAAGPNPFGAEAGAAGEPGFLPLSFHLDATALMRYLAYEYVPTPGTMYREVKSLEPAHFLLVETGAETDPAPVRYWDLPMPAARPPGDEAELCRELERLMARAVRRRLVSDVPLGVFLSGGIDSSIVAGLMARESSTPVMSFSIGFTEASYDESRYARIAAAAFGTEHFERILSAGECADELPGIVSRMDVPMADASCAPTWLLSGVARERVTVALGGDGADELWAGYEHYIGYRLAQRYNALPGWLRRGVIEPIVRHLPESSGYINPRLACETFLRGAAAPDWLRVQTLLTALGPDMQREVLAPAWLAAHGGESALAPEALFAPTKRQYEHWLPRDAAAPLARAFHVYVRQFMLDDILVKVDRCSMLHSLEVRAPFLDREVAEFAARLPVSLRLHGFKRKYLLKKAFSGLLPPEILHRNKRGFQIPVAEWLRGKLRPLMEELLGERALKAQGLFDPAAVRRLVEAHCSGRADLRKPLWTLMVLELWLRANPAEF